MQLLSVVDPTWASVQFPDPGEKDPEPDEVNDTVPVENEAPVPDVSETVAVHVVAWLAATDAGVQLTVVLVLLLLTVRAKVPELEPWLPEPAYDAVIV